MPGHEGWESDLFVVPPEEGDLCGICCEVLDDASETPCGHAFCERCIKNWLKKREVCPIDQQPVKKEDVRPMVRDRRRILQMKVKCPFCETQVELLHLRDHQAKCDDKPDDWVDPRSQHSDDEDDHKEAPAAVSPRAAAASVSPSPAASPQRLAPVSPQPQRGSVAAGSVAAARPAPAAEYAIDFINEEDEKKSPVAGNAAQQRAEQERAREQEDRDRRMAYELQMRDRELALQRQRQLSHQPARLAQPEPVELAPAQDDYVGYQGGEAEGGVIRPAKSQGCCNHRVQCCVCCLFWVVVIFLCLVLYTQWDSIKTKV